MNKLEFGGIKDVPGKSISFDTPRKGDMFTYLQELKFAERWSQDFEMQQQLMQAKTYVEKLSIIKEGGVLGIERNRIDPRNFTGPIRMFDGVTGNVAEDGKIKTTISNPGKFTKVDHVEIDNYEGLLKRDLGVLQSRQNSFGNSDRDNYLRNYSNAMELIFTDLAHEIFGPGFSILIPSEFDDVQNAADFIVVKKDKDGNIENIFSIDLFVGIAGERTEEDFLKQKIFRSLNRTQIGHTNNLNYVEIAKQRLSATNLSNLTLPISAVNLERLAEMYYKGEYDNSILDLARDTILESFQAQIRLKKKVAEEIQVKKYYDKKTKQQVTEDNKPVVLASLTRLAESLPKPRNFAFGIKDTMLTQTQRILDLFSQDFEGHIKELREFGLAQRDKIRKRRGSVQ